MSQLVRLEGKHTTQNAHCALVIEPEHHGSSSILLVHFLGHPVEEHNFFAKYRWSRSQKNIIRKMFGLHLLSLTPRRVHYIDREKNGK